MSYYEARTPQNVCVARVNFSSPNTFLRSGTRLGEKEISGKLNRYGVVS